MRAIYFTLALLTSFTLLNCQQHSSDYAINLNAEIEGDKLMYVIEREIPNAGDLTREDLKNISKASCDVIDEITEENIKWLHSYVTDNKVYCVYMAKSQDYITEHAEKGGFPANSIQKVATVIDPGTAE